MYTSPSVEQAKSYLDVQISRTRPVPGGVHHHIDGPFITLSRECGVGGSTFAVNLAKHLNKLSPAGEVEWTVFDQRIVEQVLQDEHLSARLARFLPEDRIPEIAGSVGEIVGLHPNLWSLVQKTTEFMRTVARRGHAILVGRGGNFATCGIEGGLHVRLISPESDRLQRMIETRSMTPDAARSTLRKTDAARAHYVRAVFNQDVAERTSYDLEVNVSSFTEAACLEVVAYALERRLASVRA